MINAEDTQHYLNISKNNSIHLAKRYYRGDPNESDTMYAKAWSQSIQIYTKFRLSFTD